MWRMRGAGTEFFMGQFSNYIWKVAFPTSEIFVAG